MAFVVLHHSEKSLELAGLAVERVDASGIDMSFQACNPSIVPITVEEVDGNLDSSQARYGTLAVAGKPISALSQESIEGRLNFVDFESMKSFLDLVLYDKTNPDFNATILVKENFFEQFRIHMRKIMDLPNSQTLSLETYRGIARQNQTIQVISRSSWCWLRHE